MELMVWNGIGGREMCVSGASLEHRVGGEQSRSKTEEASKKEEGKKRI